MARRTGTQEGLWWAGVVALGLVLTVLHLGATRQWLPLDQLARFEAFEPFQHRLLVPALAAAAMHVFPAVAATVWYALVEVLFWMACFVLARQALAVWTPQLPASARRLLAYTVAWPTGLHLVRSHSFELVRADGMLCRIESGDLNFARINLAPNLYYPYDLPAAVFTLLLVLLAVRYRRRPTGGVLALYAVALALAAFNRESAGLLVLALAVLLPRRPRVPYLAALVGHVAIAGTAVVVARALIAASAQPNPGANIAGSSYEFHLVNNLRTLANPISALWIVPLFAGGLWVPLVAYRRHLAPELRLLLVAAVLPMLAFSLLFGQVLEHRIFIEVQPLVWIAAVQAMASARAAALPVPLTRQGDF